MIYAVIVTYNPNILDLEVNINSILSQVDKLIVFDNNSEYKWMQNNFQKFNNVELIAHNENIGLAAAYNFVLNKHISSFDYFITFDQDTLVPPNTIENLLSYFALSNVGLVAPSINKKYDYSIKNHNDSFKIVDAVIQSCLIVKKEVFSKIGFFNEKMFIDSVDFEFCLRAKSNGFLIIKSFSYSISHQVGIPKKKFGIHFSSHNSKRNFFIARNHIMLSKKYFKKFPFFISKKNIFFLIHFFKLLFLELDSAKLKSFKEGIINGIKNDL